ncbi:MAG TPA: hypothetical protein PLB45_03825, partial [Bacilli bacterium]|nr:hypothetical protein [Bacilli bacterium]
IRKTLTIRNIISLIIISLMLVIIFVCLTIIKLSNDITKYADKSSDGRILLVSDTTDLNLIKSNEHVIFADSDKYRFGYSFYYGKGNYIYIKPIIDESVIHLTSGNNVINSNDMICSKKLYPYEYSSYVDLSKFIDSNKLIGNTLSDGTYSFNVVGSYDNIGMEEANYCYISKEGFDQLPVEGYKYFMILIDSRDNYDSVTHFLDENNIRYIDNLYPDETLYYLIKIPLLVICIVLVIILILSFSICHKNINANSRSIGLLKAYGCHEKDIIKYFEISQFFLLLISFILAYTIYFIIYIIAQPYLAKFIYMNIYIKIPFISMFAFGFAFLIFYYFIIKLNLIEKLKNEIISLIEY